MGCKVRHWFKNQYACQCLELKCLMAEEFYTLSDPCIKCHYEMIILIDEIVLLSAHWFNYFSIVVILTSEQELCFSGLYRLYS